MVKVMDAQKDKYGRTVRYFVNESHETVGVIVRRPKASIEAFGGTAYWVNDWKAGNVCTDYATLAEAKRHFA